MVVLNRNLVYAIADVLGAIVTYEPEKAALLGKETRVVNLSGLKVEITVEIVSTRLVGDVYMTLAKTVGNLAIFLVSKEVSNATVVDLHFLNLAKMDATTGWLEKHKPASVNDVLRKLDKAVVASFVKLKKNEWSKAG